MMHFAPQRRAYFRHRNFKNWSAPAVVLYILAYKCASRHSAGHFSRSELEKLVRATAACHFSRSELQKLLRECDFKMRFAPQRRAIFNSLLKSYLRTCRFSEPTFRTSGTTNHSKNTAIRDFLNILRVWSFFLVTLLAC